MNDIVNARIVLSLNASWQPIGQKTVKDALVSMNGGDGTTPPALALNIEYEEGENGSIDFSKASVIEPLSWDEWIKLPIREHDLVVHTSKMTIRVPTVIVAKNYNKVPKHIRKLTTSAIWERDGGICQYTGKKLTKSTGNIDHIVPKAKGGKDTWTNVVLADKEINSLKGHKSNHELGLKLIRQPKEPLPVPCVIIKDVKHDDWNLFLHK